MVQTQHKGNDMVDVIVYYVIPNVLMFGGLWLLAKGIETMTWNFIENYETLTTRVSTDN